MQSTFLICLGSERTSTSSRRDSSSRRGSWSARRNSTRRRKNSRGRRSSRSRTSSSRRTWAGMRCSIHSRGESTRKMMLSWTNTSTCLLNLKKYGKSRLLEVVTLNAKKRTRDSQRYLRLAVHLKRYLNRYLLPLLKPYLSQEAVKVIEGLKIILTNNSLLRARSPAIMLKNSMLL